VVWGSAAAWYGYSGDPYNYDYDEGIYYEDGSVYYGDQAVATEEEYYDQAAQIAATGEAPQNEEWLSLGVFAIAKEGQAVSEQPEKILQLSVNKEGFVAGNFYDAISGQTTAVSGAVDKKTQRVAIQPEGNPSVVVETGIYNLTKETATALVHFGKERHEKRTLVRMEQPEEGSAQAQPTG
jgi:hypothetical protein